jgi:ABC-type transport system substrate-binding protein
LGGCDGRFERLEKAALTATATSVRKRLYAQIGRIVAQQVPILYLFNADYLYAFRKHLHGFAPNPFVPTWNAYQWKIEAPASRQ